MLVGREKEKEELLLAKESETSEFVAVYGRRRIGKTFLVRETFDYHFFFQHAGIYGAKKADQLYSFAGSLKDAGMSVPVIPKTWLEAFELLKDLIRQSQEKKKILFIDELSWMDTPKSDLLAAMENFWNGWASGRKDIVLIICSSVTSWMMKKVIHNKGGLYHRLTRRILLEPFTLYECECYASCAGLGFSRLQILEAYMILGGVPYYWTLLQKKYSLAQNVDFLFFDRNAVLKDEFDHLFASLFRYPEDYQKIVRALSKHLSGMTRSALLSETKIDGSGHFSEKLRELEECGFIRSYEPFRNRKKECLYQVMDPYTVFHYHFLEKKATDTHYWSNQMGTPKLNTWNGLAFERVCLLHVDQIRRALGISGVITTVCSWVCAADEKKGLQGSQIDLLLVRGDHVINLLEMKYTDHPYVLTKKDYESLQKKKNDFYLAENPASSVHVTMVTPFGLAKNTLAAEIQSQVTMEDLFVR